MRSNINEVQASVISEDIPKFYDDLKSFDHRMHIVQSNIQPMINRQFNEKVLGNINTDLYIRENEPKGFSLEYQNIYGKAPKAYFQKSIILNINLVSQILKKENIQTDSFKIRVDSVKRGSIPISYPEELMIAYFTSIEEDIIKQTGILSLRTGHHTLQNRAKSIMTELKKHMRVLF